MSVALLQVKTAPTRSFIGPDRAVDPVYVGRGAVPLLNDRKCRPTGYVFFPLNARASSGRLSNSPHIYATTGAPTFHPPAIDVYPVYVLEFGWIRGIGCAPHLGLKVTSSQNPS
jgi:hypothetical protein